ncbi:MAG: hypothetical protein GY811_23500 [Myxococcales bacterium]|nr:hypothetical protein [Myxococcales bacterium]
MSVTASFAGTQLVSKCLLSAEPSPRWLGRQISRFPANQRLSSALRGSTDDRLIIGESSRADVPFAHSLATDFALVEARPGRFILRFDERWTGWVTTAESQRSLSELADSDCVLRNGGGEHCEFLIPAHCTIKLEFDEV